MYSKIIDKIHRRVSVHMINIMLCVALCLVRIRMCRWIRGGRETEKIRLRGKFMQGFLLSLYVQTAENSSISLMIG